MLEIDLLIVGAGPAGLFGAYYAGFRELSTAIVDSLPEAGGQVTAMYPEKMIFDVAGFPEIRGRDLVEQLVLQAAQFAPHYLLGERADGFEQLEDDSVMITTDLGSEVHAQAVIITGGIGTFTPRPLPAIGDWLGRGVTYFVKRLADHEDHDIIIVGGGDSAFDWALNLHPLARSVTMVHRRDRFRAHEHTVRRVNELGVPIMTFCEVEEMNGNAAIENVLVRNKKTGDQQTLPAQTVIAALGFTADLGPLEHWGVDLDRKHVLVDSTMATNLPRVFAAGDITEYPGKVRLIATGFGEAATAVNNAAVAINPDAKLFPGHSSDAG